MKYGHIIQAPSPTTRKKIYSLPMSLYRKYRPKLFADVYGQEHVVSTLEQAQARGKLVHAYLFAGSRGTGKTSVARILAKTLMVEGIEDEKICKQIEQGVDEGNIVDLLEIDAASNRGIDDVRDLIEKIQFSPVVAGAKVYIIDEVHMLTKEAFNALLKTLEEPPAYAYFILATTELNKIPVTVQSRCQCFPFRHIREEDIIRRLQYIADQEHIVIDREALRTIAHVSEGGMRDAISLLDQLRSLEKITLDDVKIRIGATGQEYVEEVLDALTQGDREVLIKSIAKVEEAGVPLDVFSRHLLKLTRESLHEAIEKTQSAQSLLTMQRVLLSAIRDIRISPVPGLVLEAALLSLCEEDAAVTLPTKKEELEKKLDTKKEEPKENVVDNVTDAKEMEEAKDTKETEAADDKEDTKDDTEAKEPVVEAPDLTLEALHEAWPTILRETSPASVKMSLKNGRIAELSKETVTISFTSAFHRDKVLETEASRKVEGVLEKIFKKHLKLKCEMEDGKNGGDGETKEELVNLADAAAEIF